MPERSRGVRYLEQIDGLAVNGNRDEVETVNDLGLDGKIVLVTGAASGIGRAAAQRFHAYGCKVAVADINSDGAKEVASNLGSGALDITLDLASETECTACVAATVERFGRLDVLVNAGATIVRQTLDAVASRDVQHTAMVNMGGALFMARAAARAMRANRFGRIVLFSSQGGHTGGYLGSTVYAMSKAGVLALTKSLAREYARDGITVNAVAPGLVDTPMIRRDVSEEGLARLVETIPMGCIATPEQVADCCLFLASNWSSYVTGHTLDVNGGQLMR